MGKIISIVAVVGLILSVGLTSYAKDIGPLNGGIPWPFGTEIPFPWDDIDGIWMGEQSDGEFVTYFSLRVLDQSHDERVLEVYEVLMLDGGSLIEVVSRGQGIESQRVVRGQMVELHGRGRYRFSIRAYDDDKAELEEHSIARVLTLSPIDPTDSRSVDFILHRVGKLPVGACEQKQEKQ